ncbi:MAG TPA: DUF4350 domain-containing protein [Pyrinomonadaceae bacterium]|nr:DUF4350 domain-containing protein [Pyrinomonadaceae bacterium]
MSGRFSITIFVGAMLVLLVALNAASYVRVEREAELEFRPDRSTLNAGASGTRALYEFLAESGQRVMRWREPVETLARAPEGARPATFVIVGRTRIEFKPEEIASLLAWVEGGGRLVVIDRAPLPSLLESEMWRVSTSDVQFPQRDVRADDVEMLTSGASQLAPAQPTLLTRDVSAAAPSRYASRFLVARKETDESAGEDGGTGGEDQNTNEGTTESDESETLSTPQPTPQTLPSGTNENSVPEGDPRTAATPSSDATVDVEVIDEPQSETPQSDAPVVHFADERGALLVDFARGRGRIVLLSDPFIVANRGIGRADNLQLAANVVMGASSGGGLVVFDEFHQGRGTTQNEFAAYFAGTPVLAMFAQLCLLAAVVVWTRGRRFGRTLPAPRVDRRSKLEFVASMAELQQRARAFDLAIENVYGRTRRALARYGGTDASAKFETIAAAVAARSGRKREEIEALMRECEDAINGERVTPRQSLALVARLRELERTLGIRMRAREIRQARSL